MLIISQTLRFNLGVDTQTKVKKPPADFNLKISMGCSFVCSIKYYTTYIHKCQKENKHFFLHDVKFLTAANNIMPSSFRAASCHHSQWQRNRFSWLQRCPHLPSCQHSQLQPHLAERRPRCPSGPTGASLDQPLATAVGRDSRSLRLV